MRRMTTYKTRDHGLLKGIALLVLFSVSLSGIALWRIHSIQLMTVESASMTPAIKRGDAVLLRPVSISILKPGDVVSYRSPVDQRVIVTHRVVQVETAWNQVVTKGDNASRADRPVPASALIGKVDLRVAYLGFVVQFLRSPLGLATTIYLPAFVIVALELKRLTRHYRAPTYRLLAYKITH